MKEVEVIKGIIPSKSGSHCSKKCLFGTGSCERVEGAQIGSRTVASGLERAQITPRSLSRMLEGDDPLLLIKKDGWMWQKGLMLRVLACHLSETGPLKPGGKPFFLLVDGWSRKL